MRDVVIVGGGAAGLWAAIVAAERGRDVLLIEKTPRFGTKILASGGTRCNLTTSLAPDAAAAAFGHEGARFLRTALRALPPDAVRERFTGWGVPSVEEPALEKVFPKSGRAVDVRDALVREAKAAGVSLRASTPLEGLRRAGDDSCWELRIPGDTLRARTVMLCTGGKSYPKTGTTGDGYAWLASLGLPLVEPAPALTPLLSTARWVHELAGITLEDVVVRLTSATGKVLAERRRPLLFTHRGISGPGPMDLSEPVARAELAGERGSHALAIDLCPDESWDDVRNRLVGAARDTPSRRLGTLMPAGLPRRAVGSLLAGLGWRGEAPTVGDVTKKARNRLVDALKGWSVPLSGTRGWDHAEVTAGGLSLRAVDPGSMRVRGHEGLHVFGELLDLQGPIGGFNFQSAFACAELAGLAVGCEAGKQ